MRKRAAAEACEEAREEREPPCHLLLRADLPNMAASPARLFQHGGGTARVPLARPSKHGSLPPSEKVLCAMEAVGWGGELTFPSWRALPRDSRLSAPSSVM